MSIRRKLSALAVASVACVALIPSAAQASWATATFPLPTTTSQFSGSSCVSTTVCVFAGFQSGGSTTSLAYKWNGSAYSALTPSSANSQLYGVGCNSSTLCLAVGATYSASITTHAEKYNGTSWSNTTTTTPAGATYAQLGSVSCPGATSCFAVGYYRTTTTDLPLIQTWNGTSWAVQTSPTPSGGTTVELNDISCTTTTTCTAVGWYGATTGPNRPLIQRTTNGITWSNQTGATPTGATLNQLQGVTCTGATSCNAVGYFNDAATTQHAIAQTWNGTSWTTKSVPDPADGTDAALSDIACYTTGCVAVGSYSTDPNILPLAAGWNGTSWTLQTVPRATGVSDATLLGVSCGSATTCRAAGQSLYDGSTTGVTGVRPAIDVGP